MRLPLAQSNAYSAAVSRSRLSIRYIVLPSRVKPTGVVVSASAWGTLPNGFHAVPLRLNHSLLPSASGLLATRK